MEPKGFLPPKGRKKGQKKPKTKGGTPHIEPGAALAEAEGEKNKRGQPNRAIALGHAGALSRGVAITKSKKKNQGGRSIGRNEKAFFRNHREVGGRGITAGRKVGPNADSKQLKRETSKRLLNTARKAGWEKESVKGVKEQLPWVERKKGGWGRGGKGVTEEVSKRGAVGIVEASATFSRGGE